MNSVILDWNLFAGFDVPRLEIPPAILSFCHPVRGLLLEPKQLRLIGAFSPWLSFLSLFSVSSFSALSSIFLLFHFLFQRSIRISARRLSITNRQFCPILPCFSASRRSVARSTDPGDVAPRRLNCQNGFVVNHGRFEWKPSLPLLTPLYPSLPLPPPTSPFHSRSRLTLLLLLDSFVSSNRLTAR